MRSVLSHSWLSATKKTTQAWFLDLSRTSRVEDVAVDALWKSYVISAGIMTFTVLLGGTWWGYPMGATRGWVPSCQTWPGKVPNLGYPHQIWLGGYLMRGYPMGEYLTSGNRWSTWYGAVGMPLGFTQEDFLVLLNSSNWMKIVKNRLTLTGR